MALPHATSYFMQQDSALVNQDVATKLLVWSVPKAMKEKSTAILRSEKVSKLPWLVHGFSTRHGDADGREFNLGFTKEASKAAVTRNRVVFGAAMGASGWPLITLRQIHSDLIHCVTDASGDPLTGDGLVTQTPEVLIGIQTADCLPVVLADKKKRAVGVFHAGWRGTLKRIVEKGVGEMRRHFGSAAADIVAEIGPGIHSCCYQVGEEVREQFASQFAYAAELFRETQESDPVREKYPLLFLTARAPGHSELPRTNFLDLVEANRRQLLDAGVAAKNIGASELCTSCRTDVLFSYRAERGVTGRMMAAAGIRPQA